MSSCVGGDFPRRGTAAEVRHLQRRAHRPCAWLASPDARERDARRWTQPGGLGGTEGSDASLGQEAALDAGRNDLRRAGRGLPFVPSMNQVRDRALEGRVRPPRVVVDREVARSMRASLDSAEDGRVLTRARAHEPLIGVRSLFDAANVTGGSGSPEPGALNDRGDEIIPPEWHQM